MKTLLFVLKAIWNNTPNYEEGLFITRIILLIPLFTSAVIVIIYQAIDTSHAPITKILGLTLALEPSLISMFWLLGHAAKRISDMNDKKSLYRLEIFYLKTVLLIKLIMIIILINIIAVIWTTLLYIFKVISP